MLTVGSAMAPTMAASSATARTVLSMSMLEDDFPLALCPSRYADVTSGARSML